MKSFVEDKKPSVIPNVKKTNDETDEKMKNGTTPDLVTLLANVKKMIETGVKMNISVPKNITTPDLEISLTNVNETDLDNILDSVGEDYKNDLNVTQSNFFDNFWTLFDIFGNWTDEDRRFGENWYATESILNISVQKNMTPPDLQIYVKNESVLLARLFENFDNASTGGEDYEEKNDVTRSNFFDNFDIFNFFGNWSAEEDSFGEDWYDAEVYEEKIEPAEKNPTEDEIREQNRVRDANYNYFYGGPRTTTPIPKQPKKIKRPIYKPEAETRLIPPTTTPASSEAAKLGNLKNLLEMNSFYEVLFQVWGCRSGC